MSRFILVILVCAFSLASCFTPTRVTNNQTDLPGRSPTTASEKSDPTTSAQSDTLHISKSNQTDKKVVVKDTVQSKVVKANKDKSSKIPHQTVKKVFKAVLVMPLDGSYHIGRFSEFINGLTIANQQDSKDDLGKIELNIINIGNLNNEAELSKFTAIEQADLILGGYQTSQVKTIAQLAANKGIPFISLWNSSEDIVLNNPGYIQLKPALSSYCKAISEYISREVRPDLAIILLEGKDSKDSGTIPYFENTYRKNNIAYKILYAEDNIEWKSQLGAYKSTVVNIPNWVNKNFVLSSIRQLIELQNTNITVTGMPQWETWDQVDFGLYELVHLTIPTFNFISPGIMQTGIFDKKYYDNFGTWPTTESYYGFDVFQMIKKIWLKSLTGEVFNPANDLSGQYLSYYKIQPSLVGIEEGKFQPSYYYNSYLTIKKFEGGRFVPVQ